MAKKSFDTPILLLVWKRPEKTKKIINAISKIEPKYLYVAGDGARENNKEEEKKVNETRDIIKNSINWNCKTKFLFSNDNKGCKRGVIAGINWFFKNVENGIIIEDDCLPHINFFYFCSELLDFYKDDQRIWSIGGNNFQDGKKRSKGSYYFSRYTHSWGWATWKRCWEKYDADLKNWPSFKKSGLLKTIIEEPNELKYWQDIWDKLYFLNEPDTWDYQWQLTCLMNGGLIIEPNQNLVENIGFDSEATHTKRGKSPAKINLQTLNQSSVFPITHQPFLIRSKEADMYTSKKLFSGPKLLSFKGIIRLLKKITKFFVFKFK